jgi:hypothetical protein
MVPSVLSGPASSMILGDAQAPTRYTWASTPTVANPSKAPLHPVSAASMITASGLALLAAWIGELRSVAVIGYGTITTSVTPAFSNVMRP